MSLIFALVLLGLAFIVGVKLMQWAFDQHDMYPLRKGDLIEMVAFFTGLAAFALIYSYFRFNGISAPSVYVVTVMTPLISSVIMVFMTFRYKPKKLVQKLD